MRKSAVTVALQIRPLTPSSAETLHSPSTPLRQLPGWRISATLSLENTLNEDYLVPFLIVGYVRHSHRSSKSNLPSHLRHAAGLIFFFNSQFVRLDRCLRRQLRNLEVRIGLGLHVDIAGLRQHFLCLRISVLYFRGRHFGRFLLAPTLLLLLRRILRYRLLDCADYVRRPR